MACPTPLFKASESPVLQSEVYEYVCPAVTGWKVQDTAQWVPGEAIGLGNCYPS